jgi:hypothetical protein
VVITPEKFGLKKEYQIHEGAGAESFIEAQFQNHFNYKPKSKRQKFADVWVNPKFGYNIKTSVNGNLGGRICTVDIASWLSIPDNQLKIIHVHYNNNRGHLILTDVCEYFIEEIEYNILNQGKGFLHMKTDSTKKVIKTREKLDRQLWLQEFQSKYIEFVENTKKRFDINAKKFASLTVSSESNLINFMV